MINCPRTTIHTAAITLACACLAASASAAPGPATAIAPSAAPAATQAAALPALDSPEAAVHELLVAMALGDQDRVNRCTVKTNGRDILTKGQKASPLAAEISAGIVTAQLHRLKPGDKLTLPTKSGPIVLVLDDQDINENRQQLVGGGDPVPFVVVREGNQWKVDADPLIAARRSAAAAAAAAADRAAAQSRPATSPATAPHP